MPRASSSIECLSGRAADPRRLRLLCFTIGASVTAPAGEENTTRESRVARRESGRAGRACSPFAVRRLCRQEIKSAGGIVQSAAHRGLRCMNATVSRNSPGGGCPAISTHDFARMLGSPQGGTGTMRRLPLFTVVSVATAVGGCAWFPAYMVSPPPMRPGPAIVAYENQARRYAASVPQSELSSVDQPRQRRRVASRAATTDGTRTDEDNAPEHPRYSEEWWKAQAREDDKMRRTLNICRGC
jgi:hypothetical protein